LWNHLPKGLTIFAFPIAMNGSSCLSASFLGCSSVTFIFVFLNFSHASRCVWVSYCFNKNSLVTNDGEHLYIGLFATYISSLVRSIQIFLLIEIGLFVLLLLNIKNSLYILNTSPLSDTIYFTNIFSQSVVCLFILSSICHKVEYFNFNEF
jgi:hypothetical protein